MNDAFGLIHFNRLRNRICSGCVICLQPLPETHPVVPDRSIVESPIRNFHIASKP